MCVCVLVVRFGIGIFAVFYVVIFFFLLSSLLRV